MLNFNDDLVSVSEKLSRYRKSFSPRHNKAFQKYVASKAGFTSRAKLRKEVRGCRHDHTTIIFYPLLVR